MNEEVPPWMQNPSSSSSTESILQTRQPVATQDTGRKKSQKDQRQLLSCTSCRERKVKCDRTKPCSSCCARGIPKECHFVVAEGNTYEPILQSYELRKLRAENLRLKERLRAGKLSVDDEPQRPLSPSQSLGDRPGSRAKRPVVRQKRFKDTKSENLYFGSPGLASIVNDFARLQVGSQSLSHSMPRKVDPYATQDTGAYPFATLWPPTLQECIPGLLACLPPKEQLLGYLDSFQRRAQTCSFPHVPDEITTTEVERFLSDAPRNAELFPDMLALLFAALANGSQSGVFDKSGKKWEAGAMEAEQKKFGDIYIAASMQALRMASFMNRPTLLGIQTLLMIAPYLTNSGRFLDAWTLFGTTIRLAHSIGLHRNPKYLDPAPPLQECTLRQTLWWWMLHLDQQYSMTLGRPLGISGIGDCPPAEPLTTNPTILRLSEYINQYTVLARQILSSDRLTITKIDWFTDRLISLWDTMPELLQFDETWFDEDKQLPEWPLEAMAAVFYGKTQNYLTLLNRQRIEPVIPSPDVSQSPPQITNQSSGSTVNPMNASMSQANPCDRTRMPPPPLPNQTSSASDTPTTTKSKSGKLASNERGRPLVLSSSRSLINAFLFIYHRVPAALLCWTMGQQAFNSCMILLLDAMETGNLTHMSHVERAFAVFVELKRLGVHKLAGLAVQRVSWGLAELGKKQIQRRGVTGNFGAAEASSSGSGASATEDRREPSFNAAELGSVDTVMSNTGMLLLEDPGLQSFVPESFRPLGWGMAGQDLQQNQHDRPQPQSDVSPFYNPTVSAPLSLFPYNEETTQQTGGFNTPGMAHAQTQFQGSHEPHQQHQYQYQPLPSPQYQLHPPFSYEAQSRAPLRSLDMFPVHSASFQSYQEATPQYGDMPVQLNLRDPDVMNMGGNPGWAARPGAVFGAYRSVEHGRSGSETGHGSGSDSGGGFGRR